MTYKQRLDKASYLYDAAFAKEFGNRFNDARILRILGFMALVKYCHEVNRGNKPSLLPMVQYIRDSGKTPLYKAYQIAKFNRFHA